MNARGIDAQMNITSNRPPPIIRIRVMTYGGRTWAGTTRWVQRGATPRYRVNKGNRVAAKRGSV